MGSINKLVVEIRCHYEGNIIELPSGKHHFRHLFGD